MTYATFGSVDRMSKVVLAMLILQLACVNLEKVHRCV